MPLVVHGLLSADAADVLDPSVEGVEASTAVVVHGEVAALVTATGEVDLLPSRANLLTHTRVLEAAAEATTVVPMRFGTVVPDEEALVATYLRPEHDAIGRRLDDLTGRLEVRVRATYDEDQAVRAVLDDDRRAAQLRGRDDFEARMELGERIAAGIAARRDDDARYTVEAVRRHVIDVAPATVSEPLDAFTVSFLVDRDALTAFEGSLEQVADELAPRVRMELIGPLPPFSFAATA
ncbi:MAG: GvpL/GvpF family gas vesicle protein [Actinobacteria bacterium]|nr:GvpL/GvpF family gas vesicle protein [Actinomycetota bacterium]